MPPEPIVQAWPTELRLSTEKNLLHVTFADGLSSRISAEFLRVFSPSAEVQGHSPSERKLISGKRDVKITKIDPVGNYAVRLVFSDGHSTGIFSWDYLHDVSKNYNERWSGYLDELVHAGRTRDK